MPESQKTPGEIVFERYLNSQSIAFEFEKPHAGKSKRPDYTIEWDGHTVVFDVKDFDPPKSFSMGFSQVRSLPTDPREDWSGTKEVQRI